MMDADERTEVELLDGGVSSEAVAFMMELGMCPGSACSLSRGGCDPRCPALVTWVEEISRG